MPKLTVPALDYPINAAGLRSLVAAFRLVGSVAELDVFLSAVATTLEGLNQVLAFERSEVKRLSRVLRQERDAADKALQERDELEKRRDNLAANYSNLHDAFERLTSDQAVQFVEFEKQLADEQAAYEARIEKLVAENNDLHRTLDSVLRRTH